MLKLGRSLILTFALPVLAGAADQFQKVATQFALAHPAVPDAVQLEPSSTTAWNGSEPGPVDGLRVYAREKNGAVWLGSTNGAARFDARAKHRWDRWQYFHGRRWLADDDVHHIVVEESTASRRAWIRTRTGVAQIEWRPMTLEQKAAAFDARIEARHVRHGMVADCNLRSPGDLAASSLSDSDNDGLWTAMYLGAECYRYKVTGSPEARRHAQRAVRLLQRLEEITGHPGFPARSFVESGQSHDNGEWHPTPDGRWLWKGDTSSDEIVGHYFGYALFFDLVADDSEKDAIRAVVRRLTDHLIRHDYDLIDLDGQPTRWGQWSERYFKTEEGAYEAALRSLELLAFLKTAHHITGDPKYAAAYQDRLARGYGEKMKTYRRWSGGGEINFSDDELAYLSYDPLLRYEREPHLRKLYLESLRFTWSQIRRDMNPLWNYISVASGAGRLTGTVRDESRRTLQRIPMDLVTWTMRNSHRRDVTFEADKDRFARNQIRELLAPDERAVHKWNSNPFIPDGGSGGRGEDDGAFFLLPYWMGRYLQAVD